MRSSFRVSGTFAAMLLASVSASAVLAADLRTAPPVVVPVLPTLLPAVSGINGKFELGAGGAWGDAPYKDGFLGYGAGTITFPLAQQWGGQIDGYLGTQGGEAQIGVGGHLFWRDPAKGLLGIYGEFSTTKVETGRFNTSRVGPEFELYLGRMNLSGIVGYEWANLGVDKGFFVDAVASYFATDDLRLYVGGNHGFAGTQGKAGVEWQLPGSYNLANTSVFAEGRIGEDGYRAAFAGVKIGLGAPKKSLIRQYREDDPLVWIKQNMHDVGQATAKGKFKNKDGGPVVSSGCPSGMSMWSGSCINPA